MRYFPIIIFFTLLALSFYPFLPGEYDSLAVPLATLVQLTSGLALLTCIPALLWLIQALRYRKANPEEHFWKKIRQSQRLYVWITTSVLITAVAFTAIGISTLLGICLFFIAGIACWRSLKTIKNSIPSFSIQTPVSLLFLPILVFSIQVIITPLLTTHSRLNAIDNCRGLIEEIEGFHATSGHYPKTLNALWKDYGPGIKGIEKYHYTYDSSTYHIYFEQPRFFFDQFGTREMVVYNPHHKHVMLSHASWHIRFSEHQRATTQGWYASFDTRSLIGNTFGLIEHFQKLTTFMIK